MSSSANVCLPHSGRDSLDCIDRERSKSKGEGSIDVIHTDLEKGVEARESLVTLLEGFFAEVKEVDKGRIDSEQGVRLLQNHITNACLLTPLL